MLLAKGFKAVVVGQESIHNLRLSEILRKIIGKDNVLRYLETRHLFEYLAEDDTKPIGIFFDLFSFEPSQSVDTIGYVRKQYPKAVFCLYLSNVEQRQYWQELPSNWQERLDHYFMLYKEPEDTVLELIVRGVLRRVFHESTSNIQDSPLRLTTTDDGTAFPSHSVKTPIEPTHNTLFVSYSRRDWDNFVSPLVNRLQDKGFSVWVDQHLLEGGDDWMDAIGEALDKCKLLLLVMSPDALESKFVKMEYRYFFNHDRAIIPLLYRSVERIPPELSVTQHIDFSQSNTTSAFSQLVKVIEAKL
jgi:hypothetical protein